MFGVAAVKRKFRCWSVMLVGEKWEKSGPTVGRFWGSCLCRFSFFFCSVRFDNFCQLESGLFCLVRKDKERKSNPHCQELCCCCCQHHLDAFCRWKTRCGVTRLSTFGAREDLEHGHSASLYPPCGHHVWATASTLWQ